MTNRTRTSLALATLFALLAAALVAVAPRALEQTRRAGAMDLTYVPLGAPLRLLGGGAKLSIADYYWLIAVQYIGDESLRGGDFAKLYALVDLVTDLDPAHGYAYQTAGIVLSSAGRLDESDRILRKGIESGPAWWSYPFYIAFNHYFYRNDYDGAAVWAERAARTPGASTNISHLALALKAKSGRPEEAIAFLDELRGVAKDEATEKALDEQYRLAVMQRDFATLDAAIDRFREARGRLPRRLEELVAEGFIGRIPPEPFGGRYYVGADGKAHGTKKDFRFSPPELWRAPSFAPRAQPGAAAR